MAQIAGEHACRIISHIIAAVQRQLQQMRVSNLKFIGLCCRSSRRAKGKVYLSITWVESGIHVACKSYTCRKHVLSPFLGWRSKESTGEKSLLTKKTR